MVPVTGIDSAVKIFGFRSPGALIKRAGALAFIGVVERIFFTRFSWPRRMAESALPETIALVTPRFDAGLYLRQMRAPLRRRRAARAPVLHYALIGWREHRAPNAYFDPRFYRQETPGLSLLDEPYAHFLREGAGRGAAQNEIDASRRDFPANARALEFVLVLHHPRGGGSSRFLAKYEAHLMRRGIYPLRLRLLSKSTSIAVCEDDAGSAHVFDLAMEPDQIIDFAKRIGVKRILVNHVIDMPTGIFDWIIALARALEAPIAIVLHDYFALCPRVNLVDANGRFCGIATPEQCVACVSADGGEIGAAKVTTWRSDFLQFLSHAEEVIVPARDAAERLSPFLQRPLKIWPPDDDAETPPLRLRDIGANEPLRIAIIGGIDAAKGSRPLLELARAASTAKAPLSLSLIGSSDRDRHLRAAGVAILGRYRDVDLQTRINEVDPHVVFLPSIWPETWSFVLTHALQAARPTVVFDIGAPAERLRSLGRERFLLPYDLISRPDLVMTFFLSLRDEWIRDSANGAQASSPRIDRPLD